MPLEVAAVTVPFRMNAGSSLPSDSGVSPARGVSSAVTAAPDAEPGASTDAISSLNVPAAAAANARR
jgi:hypothetical protein